MALVLNMIPVPLPNPAVPLKFAQKRKRDDLERRSSLASKDRKNDLEPLNEEEEKEYRDLQIQRRCEDTPLAGGIELKFAALGQPGCVRELAYPMAAHLARTKRIYFRGVLTPIIRLLRQDEKPAEAIAAALAQWNEEHSGDDFKALPGAETPTPQSKVTAPKDDPRYRQERPSQGAAAGTFFNRQVEGPRLRA
jgi:transglutaminase-like putative cysteine protease